MNVLIVDNENEIAEIIEFVIQEKFPGITKVFFANNAHEAMAVLFDSSIDLCIADHLLAQGTGLDVLQYIIKQKFKTKFILCCTIPLKELPENYPTEHVYFNIIKPEIFDGVSKVAELLNADLEEEYISKEVYVPISADFIDRLEKAPYNIFVKVNEEEYLKYLSANESFGLLEKEAYLAKHTEKLYFKKPSNQIYLDHITANEVDRLMRKINIPLSERMSLAQEQIIALIKTSSLTLELSQVTKDNVKLTTELLNKENFQIEFWTNTPLKGEYSSQVYALHTMLAAYILKKLKQNTDSNIFAITIAAFFQNIFLDSLALIKLYDYSDFLYYEQDFNRHEIKTFLEHPQKSKDLIAAIKNIPLEVDRILLEHHEMPDGSGFPRKLTSNKISPLSCVFIISGIFAKYALEHRDNFELQKLIEILETRGYNKDNFKDSFAVIKKM